MIATDTYCQEERSFGLDTTLSGEQWFESQFSMSQNELDRSHRTWWVQREKTPSVEQTFRIGIRDPLPSWLPDVVNSLNSLLVLEDNWDSYGAQKIDAKATIAAIQVLLSVMEEETPQPSIVPTPLGGVQLEWHRFGIDLEVEITPSMRYLISYNDETDETEFDEDNTDNHLMQDVRPLLALVDQITQRASLEK